MHGSKACERACGVIEAGGTGVGKAGRACMGGICFLFSFFFFFIISIPFFLFLHIRIYLYHACMDASIEKTRRLTIKANGKR